jgi:RimJ/RimL family protein N-acetyltransferase
MSEASLATTPFQLSDAGQFYELCKDSEIKLEFPNLRFENIQDAENYLENRIGEIEKSSLSFFKAIRIVFNGLEEFYTDKNNILIGFISLNRTGSFDQILAGGIEHTLRYAIKSEYRRKGLMTIALNLTLDAMYQDGYNILAATVKKENIPSLKVLEKCGFVMVRDSGLSLLYVKRIKMDEYEFNQTFNL